MHVGQCVDSTCAIVGLVRMREGRDTDDTSLKADGSPTAAVAALRRHTFATLVRVMREFGYFCFFGLIHGGVDLVPRAQGGCT